MGNVEILAKCHHCHLEQGRSWAGLHVSLPSAGAFSRYSAMADSKWKRRRIGRKKKKLQGKRSTEDDVELVQQTSPDKVLKPCSSFPSVVPVVIAVLCSLPMPCSSLCATHEIVLQHCNPRFCRRHITRFAGTQSTVWRVLSGVGDLTARTLCSA